MTTSTKCFREKKGLDGEPAKINSAGDDQLPLTMTKSVIRATMLGCGRKGQNQRRGLLSMPFNYVHAS